MAACHLFIQGQQLLLLFRGEVSCHSRKAVEICVAALVQDPFHITQGRLKLIPFDSLNGRNLKCMKISRIYIKPKLCQLLLGIVTIERLGNAHGSFYDIFIPGLLRSSEVINQSDIIPATLCCNFCREKQVKDFGLKICVFYGWLAACLPDAFLLVCVDFLVGGRCVP